MMLITRTRNLLSGLALLIHVALLAQTNPEVPYFTIVSPASMRAFYALDLQDFGPAFFGNGLTNGDVIATLALPPDSLYCDSITADFTGKIVLIARGTCEFGRKVWLAEQNGAVGVLIYSRDETTIKMGAGAQGALVTIPSIMIKYSVGNVLRQALLQGEEVRIALTNHPFEFGILSGKIQYDQNNNCQTESTETGLAGWFVTAQGNGATFGGMTNVDGTYNFGVDSAAAPYTLFAQPLYGAWAPCPATVNIPVVYSQQIITNNFAATPVSFCPALKTDIGVSFLRRCFPNYFQAKVCNLGTATAEDAYVDIHLQWPQFEPISSASQPYSTLGPGAYRFQMGNLAVGECFNVHFTATIACGDTTQIGQTLCIEAQAHPDTFCIPTQAGWNGANVSVNGKCEGMEVVFTIGNTGTGSMESPSEFIVIEDDVMRQSGNVQLSPNGTRIIRVPANGSTWRIEATQVPNHPVPNNPSITVEGCSSGNSFTTGYHLMFPVYDPSPAFDRECLPIVGSFDPNDKQGLPKGVGDQGLILANTDLEYLIRFQNTGTDTAFNIVVRDTLAFALDPSTVLPGASSADYAFEIQRSNILVFRFKNIRLVDSFTNEPLSHGYVRFKVSQRPDMPEGTPIHNKAGIYFDFNPPVLTNETAHTVGYVPHVSATGEPHTQAVRLDIFPNPAQPGAEIRLKADLPDGLNWRLSDNKGNWVESGKLLGGRVRLRQKQLPLGTYYLELVQDGRPIGQATLLLVRGE